MRFPRWRLRFDACTPRPWLSAGTRSTGVQVIGVEPRREEKMTGLANTISSGRFLAGNDDGEIVLGFGVARSAAPGAG